MSAWKQHLGCHGASVGLQQRLTNIRYADDLNFGDGEDELVYMLQFFPPNSAESDCFFSKRKCSPRRGWMSQIQMWSSSTMNILMWWKTMVPTNASSAFGLGYIEFRETRTNKNISIKLPLRLFDAVVTPAILFGLVSMLLTASDLNQLDAIQRRMVRSLVSMQDEPWRGRMIRMKKTCATSFTLHFHVVQSWKYRFANQLFSFATEVAGTCGWLRHVIKWCPFDRWQKKSTTTSSKQRTHCEKMEPQLKCFLPSIRSNLS